MGGGDRVQPTGHVKKSEKNYAISLELHHRVVGSGPAQQAMLSEGSDPATSALSTIRTNFFKWLLCGEHLRDCHHWEYDPRVCEYDQSTRAPLRVWHSVTRRHGHSSLGDYFPQLHEAALRRLGAHLQGLLGRLHDSLQTVPRAGSDANCNGDWRVASGYWDEAQ